MNKNEIIETIKSGNKYKGKIQNNVAMVYLSKDKSDKSQEVNLVLGYKPLLDEI